MFFIEGISIRNFRSLRNVHIGRHWGTKEEALPELVCCIGAPNTGKAEFWDVFKFIRDLNQKGVMQACADRGGLRNIHTKGTTDPVEFEFVLSDKAGNEYHYILSLKRDELNTTSRDDRVTVNLVENKTKEDYLSLINAYFSQLFVPEFTEAGLRNSFDYSASDKLVEDGSNFVTVLAGDSENKDKDLWFRQRIADVLHTSGFHAVVKPVFDITGTKAYHQKFALYEHDYAGYPEDNRNQYSTNTLRYIAYMVLAGTLDRHQLVMLQGIENGLYFTLQEYLAEAMLSAARRNQKTVIMLTYSPQVLNMLDDKNVFVFYKDQDDYTEIVQASRVPLVHNMIQEGFQMGHLWTSEYLMPDQNGNFSENETEE